MLKKIDIETMIGGIAALIAVLAILVQVWQNSFTQSAIWEGIKDVSTTSVAIIVLVVAVRKLKPRVETETFEGVLESELDKWVSESSTLINKAVNFPISEAMLELMNPRNNSSKPTDVEISNDENEVNRKDEEIKRLEKLGSTLDRYNMLTNFDTIVYTDKLDYKDTAKKGRFVEILKTKKFTSLYFYLNESTFLKRVSASKEPITIDTMLEIVAPAIAGRISPNFPIVADAKPNSQGTLISVTFKKVKLDSPEDARQLVALIKYVMTLYIILA